MRTATHRSWLARISAMLVIVFAPLATLAQDGLPQAVREFSQPLPQARTISPNAGKALNEAITALNKQQYSDARAALGELKLDRLKQAHRCSTRDGSPWVAPCTR